MTSSDIKTKIKKYEQIKDFLDSVRDYDKIYLRNESGVEVEFEFDWNMKNTLITELETIKRELDIDDDYDYRESY